MNQAAVRSKPLIIGVLSDTHGHVLASVLQAFREVDHIIHAGDVGSYQVLAALSDLAPVTAVRGNCDFGSWAQELPEASMVELGPVLFLVAHMPARAAGLLETSPGSSGSIVVVSGHTHRPHIERRENILFLNPGTAGSSRFEWSRTVALVEVFQAGYVEGQILRVA
ncbi:MAG: metallophosphatase family protein [Thermoleophilia bacterium]|nr:metallophosphatase family protein [Thermoleophilia bacterium]